MEQQNLFDYALLKEFKVGDLVSWKRLKNAHKEYGYIVEIYSENRGINRSFLFASIITTNGTKEAFHLSYLTKEAS
jgi:hypothetical protein